MIERKVIIHLDATTKKYIILDDYGIFSIIKKLSPNGHYIYAGPMVDTDHSDNGCNGEYVVTAYNSLDAGFGYDCGDFIIYDNLSKAAARSIVRNFSRTKPEFMCYGFETHDSYTERQCPVQFR